MWYLFLGCWGGVTGLRNVESHMYERHDALRRGMAGSETFKVALRIF